MSGQFSELKSKLEIGVMPSVSIFHSKSEIEEIEQAMEQIKHHKKQSISGTNKKQISKGATIDWKQFYEEDQLRNQLVMKDIENQEKVLFSYLIEEWKDQQPFKVIYKWIRKGKPFQRKRNSEAHLLEEQHIYRGEMLNKRKNGNGIYIIFRKYDDNSEKITKIKGVWSNDILQNGFMTDESGKQQVFSQNFLKLNICSKKLLTPYVDKNEAIQEIKKHSLQIRSTTKLQFKESAFSIPDMYLKH